MSHYLFTDTLLARGLSASGLKDAVIVDPAAELALPSRIAFPEPHRSNPADALQADDHATPLAWHALLKTH